MVDVRNDEEYNNMGSAWLLFESRSGSYLYKIVCEGVITAQMVHFVGI